MARRSSRLISVALLAVGAVAGGAAPSVAADGGTPQIGARVRVQVSGLWPGWHMGVFNRLRVEPPCYRVLVFGPTHHVERMLSIREIERIQVSSLFDGHTRAEPTDPTSGRMPVRPGATSRSSHPRKRTAVSGQDR
jgi:hypothetical protein